MEFLTEVLKLPKERLWVTVHISDDEAADIWIKKIGVDPERLSRLDEDNFGKWAIPDPVDPVRKYFGITVNISGGAPGSKDDDLDRYIEIWNLVFMQFERDSSGEMTPYQAPQSILAWA